MKLAGAVVLDALTITAAFFVAAIICGRAFAYLGTPDDFYAGSICFGLMALLGAGLIAARRKFVGD